MSLKNPSIRFRLTLWYTIVLLIILGIVSLGVYFFMRGRLESMVQGKLDNGYATVEAVLINSGGDIYDVYHFGQTMMFRLTKEEKTAYQTQAWQDAFQSMKFDNYHFNPYASWKSPQNRLYRLKRGLISEYGFELSFAQDVTDFEESMQSLAMILLAAFPFALICAIVGGYLLAGRVLSPVIAITNKARKITADRLSERLPIKNPQDEIGLLVTVFNDTLARLEHSFERLRRFTADASHELRTPLTSIRSVGEVALQGPQTDQGYRETIGSMLEETERITNLIDSLLTLAREDSGQVQLLYKPLHLSSFMADVVNELRILAEEKNQTLSLEKGIPIEVTVDATTLRQAVANVLHNAIRYTPEGGHIEIALRKTWDRKATIDITDDGPGIPDAERSKVFERFYRLDKARSRAEGGSGLGLAIAKWAVEANHGTIAFIDTDSPGSCCRITLPVEK
jgi:heavy metal sensor kinase